MRLLGPLVVVLVLLLPAPARAQSVAMADIVGVWVGGVADSTSKGLVVRQNVSDTLLFQADSTWKQSSSPFSAERLSLQGDTVEFGARNNRYKIALKDQQITFTGMRETRGTYMIYRRVAAPTPKP